MAATSVSDQNIGGIHLVQADTEIGGFSLSAGQLLVSLQSNDTTVGDTPTIDVKRQDIFVLDVTVTEPGGGTTAATATRFFEGLDESLDTQPGEHLGHRLPGQRRTNRHCRYPERR